MKLVKSRDNPKRDSGPTWRDADGAFAVLPIVMADFNFLIWLQAHEQASPIFSLGTRVSPLRSNLRDVVKSAGSPLSGENCALRLRERIST
jgi:hypothetical protein